MSSHSEHRIETRAVHAGQSPEPQTGAVMTPVYLNSTYAQDYPGELKDGHDYSRTINPTRSALERNLAALEGGKHGLGFASGMAAIHGIFERLSPGDHVIAGNDLYGGTHRVFMQVFARFGLEFTLVDATDPAQVRAAMRDSTKVVYVETPTNPLLSVVDIEACAAIAHEHGAHCVVDNTFATPYLQSPLELGADVVVHSLTKYLGGHSDVVAGAVVCNDDQLAAEIAFHQNASGGQLGPMDAFLVLRGTKTLAVRMDRHCENAMQLARFLETRPEVERVIYPGLESHPNHAVAAKQMRGFGGMISFELAGGVEAGCEFSRSTQIFTLAESLGGVESLVEVPPIMTHASIPAEERHKAGLADGLVRLSVGIEHVDDLQSDLEQALVKAAKAAPVA